VHVNCTSSAGSSAVFVYFHFLINLSIILELAPGLPQVDIYKRLEQNVLQARCCFCLVDCNDAQSTGSVVLKS